MKKSLVAIIMSLIMVLLTLAGCSSSDNKKTPDPTQSPSAVISDLLQKENYDEAVLQYNNMKYPDQTSTDTVTKEIDSVYDNYKLKLIEYKTAISKLDAFYKINDKNIKRRSRDVKQKVNDLHDSRTAYETAVLYEKEKNYKDAIAQYSLVIEEDDNYNTAQEKIKSCTTTLRDEAIAKADAFIKDNDYVGAINTLIDANKNLQDDTITQKIEVYSKTYVTDILNQADALVSEKKLDEAIDLLKYAKTVVPNNTELKDRLNSIEDLKPVPLQTLHILENTHSNPYLSTECYYYSDEGITDAYGNDYSQAHIFRTYYSHEAYCLYFLNGEYLTITGTLVMSTNSNSSSNMYINIYADDELVYSKRSIDRLTKAFTFSADVTGADKMKIVVGISKSGGELNYLAIVNGQMNKI